ncbi:very long chain fatty acid elongase 7-like [Haliotis cracherodii]|uniref:very long chain fatty acid elongase 7-like n=1 Tax=Haliotis cracherodii TaxID=6455 RepID=UPI0039E97AAE
MAAFTALMDKYKSATTDLRDLRTDGWFLMESVWPTVATVLVYLVIVTWGPRLMSNRPAFQLNNVLVAYNFCLMLLSMYMVFEFVVSAWLRPGFSLACQAVDYSSDPMSVRLAHVCWWFYFSKLIELLDTVFFVLRKKGSQISFLHVYHHSTMPILWWAGVKFVAGGEGYFSASINSFVHVLMYLYYLLSAMGPSMRKYLWWKKYMTSIQLVQFWAILIHTSYSIYLNCGYPLGYNIGFLSYMISHIVLFSNFYYQAYINKSHHSAPLKNGSAKTKHQNGVMNGTVKSGVTNGKLRKRIE